MNKLTRDFNVAERILLGILGILLVAVAYYYLVHLAVADDLASARAERDSLETELIGVQTRVAQLEKMQNEIDGVGTGPNASRMESYNNAKAEIALLNDILTAARQYSISFSGVSRDGDLIRRSFQLSFTADSFDTAEGIHIHRRTSNRNSNPGNDWCNSSGCLLVGRIVQGKSPEYNAFVQAVGLSGKTANFRDPRLKVQRGEIMGILLVDRQLAADYLVSLYGLTGAERIMGREQED